MTMYLAEDMPPDDLDFVKRMARDTEYIDHIYLHWTAGHYGQCYDDYHICIDKDGSLYVMCDSFDEVLAHTWHRNRHAIGIALTCCADASCKADGTIDLGTEPPTAEQIEAMAQCGGLLVLNSVDEPSKYSTYFLKIDGVKFRQKVVPGDTLIFRVELLAPIRRGISSMKGYVFVGEKVVCEAEFTAQIVKNK